jgi:hypothetical protein
MILDNSAAPGDFSTIAPNVTVNVQDAISSQATTSATKQNGVYTNFSANVYLKGVNSNFATSPDYVAAHEYGHVWTLYHLFLSQDDNWSSYLNFRWANDDGSVRLANDPRLNSSYTWTTSEIVADDYMLLFGTGQAISQHPFHLNPYIPEPSQVPGLRDFFLNTWQA